MTGVEIDFCVHDCSRHLHYMKKYLMRRLWQKLLLNRE